MIKFLVLIFLIIETIFFLMFYLQKGFVSGDGYFWQNSELGVYLYNFYDDFAFNTFFPLTIVLIIFNILASWLGSIKRINKLIISVVYIELIGIIATIPTMFVDTEASFLFCITLVSAIVSLALLFVLGKIFNSRIKILLLTFFSIVSIITFLFLEIASLAGSGAA